jgi:DNA modification methylase
MLKPTLNVGNEKSPAEYVQNLRAVFVECYRVLKENGTLWLNLGDKYLDGNLLGMPWQVAFALKEDGWILRSDIIDIQKSFFQRFGAGIRRLGDFFFIFHPQIP